MGPGSDPSTHAGRTAIYGGAPDMRCPLCAHGQRSHTVTAHVIAVAETCVARAVSALAELEGADVDRAVVERLRHELANVERYLALVRA